jgi:hypothetical protein
VGQGGEVGVDAAVDAALGVEQGPERELVEQDHHHRRVAPVSGRRRRPRGRRRPGRQDQRRGRRDEQEQQGEHQRGRGQEPQPQPRPGQARVQHAPAQAADGGHRGQRRAPQAGGGLDHLDGQQHQQPGDGHKMQVAPGRRAGQPGQLLHGPDGQCRQDRHADHQDEDVQPAGPAEQEHVRAAAGDVQQRLGDDQPGQREQLGQGPQVPAAAGDRDEIPSDGSIWPGGAYADTQVQ